MARRIHRARPRAHRSDHPGHPRAGTHDFHRRSSGENATARWPGNYGMAQHATAAGDSNGARRNAARIRPGDRPRPREEGIWRGAVPLPPECWLPSIDLRVTITELPDAEETEADAEAGAAAATGAAGGALSPSPLPPAAGLAATASIPCALSPLSASDILRRSRSHVRGRPSLPLAVLNLTVSLRCDVFIYLSSSGASRGGEEVRSGFRILRAPQPVFLGFQSLALLPQAAKGRLRRTRCA